MLDAHCFDVILSKNNISLPYLVHIANVDNMVENNPFMASETNSTIPATEENLSLEVDRHMMDQQSTEPLSEPSPPHSVIVDGIRGEAAIGYFGTWSPRISILLEEKHPELGEMFMTKYYQITEPGVLILRGFKKTFQIVKIQE